MNRILTLFALVAGLALAQTPPTGSRTAVSDMPFDFWNRLIFTTGMTTYVCSSRVTTVELYAVAYSEISEANGAVVTSTHGFDARTQNPRVTITGGTGNWAALNGTHTVTVSDSTHFTIPVDTSRFGAITGTITIKANAPRLTDKIWAVSKAVTDNSGIALGVTHAIDGYSNVCSNRATLAYQ